jgi:hypothetical protein
MSKLIFYVAGTFAEYNEYRRRKSKEGKETSDWRYVSGVDSLRGMKDITGYYIGSFRNRKDIDELRTIIDQIKERKDGDA